MDDFQQDMEPQCEAMPQAGMVRRPHRLPEIPFLRRKELLAFAVKLVEQVREQVKPHELCLLDTFVRGLVERD
jgi:hypothetical protein